jgi:hypothetical protein
MTGRRPCSSCGRNRAERFFTSERGRTCADCRKAKRSASTHARRVEKTYGLTAEQYEALLAHQGGACAICAGERRYRLNVDHDHATGAVRGLLCRRCNRLLRDVRDNAEVLEAAAYYLAWTPAEAIGLEAVST